MDASDFLCEQIEVETQDRRPVALTWRGRRHEVVRVLQMWHDIRFGPTPSRVKNGWWQRRHRTCFQVQIAGGELLQIYWDRGSIGKKWYVSRQLHQGDKQGLGPGGHHA